MSENNSIDSEEGARSSGGIRIFALAIGLAAVVAVCIVVAYSELVVSRSTSGACLLLGSSQIPPAAVAVLLAMVGINGVIKRLTPRWKLSAVELGAIYMMSAAAALISAFGLTVLLLPTTALGNYFADPQNRWQSQILSHLPRWMVPFDPHGPEK